ncbi:MAG: hypothetical protein RJB60_1410, partial [Pseudomonadota bacterium]
MNHLIARPDDRREDRGLTLTFSPLSRASLVLLSALSVVCAPSMAAGNKARPAGTSAAASATSLQAITSVEGISEYRLPNGLQVLLIPDDSKPTTTVNVTYRVGSCHENYGETGMAHLLEHLLFKGSPRHPNV